MFIFGSIGLWAASRGIISKSEFEMHTTTRNELFDKALMGIGSRVETGGVRKEGDVSEIYENRFNG